MQRVLAHYFARHEENDSPWLAEQASAIRGMVEAGAGESHVAGYLYRCLRELALPVPPRGRTTAVALWHIAKAALVRDFAERVLSGEIPRPIPTPDSLSHWLAALLLTADELEDFVSADDPVQPYADSPERAPG